MAHFSFQSSAKTKFYMKKIISTLTVFLSLATIATGVLSFTNQGTNLDEVIGALKDGKASELGKYMDDNVEISLPDKSNNYSKAQAILVLKDFFDNNEVKSFEVKHKGDQNGGQYCVGTLQTKSGNYRTTVFMKTKTGKDYIKAIRFQSVE
ncbi:MAG: DUF4783 domain-containing protein [Bacteroidetes bacterium]|nr:MAG: DUF4783 domain-containing protein [Bacteroidota bacterium]